MPAFNPATREVRFKIVYGGAAYAGKSTSLNRVHARLDAERRGELVSMSTAADRTLSFDFLPEESVEVEGCRVRFQLCTVPGQAVYPATLQLVLRGVDGIVFVADSDPRRQEANELAWRAMWTHIQRNGDDASAIPVVLQANKRDLPQAAPVNEITRGLAPAPSPALGAWESIAECGKDVFPPLNEVCQSVLGRFLSANQPSGSAP